MSAAYVQVVFNPPNATASCLLNLTEISCSKTATTDGITYIYDAAGNKLEKRVIDNSNASTPGVSTITDYMGAFQDRKSVV